MSKIFTIACVQAVGTVSFRFILYLVHELVVMTSRHPIFFVDLSSKQANNNYFKPRSQNYALGSQKHKKF